MEFHHLIVKKTLNVWVTAKALPNVKSEAGRKTFGFLGAKIFNKLLNNMKTESSIVKFKTACKDFNFDF